MSERYERAAAVSVFRGNMRRGILTLTDGADLARQQGHQERCMSLSSLVLPLLPLFSHTSCTMENRYVHLCKLCPESANKVFFLESYVCTLSGQIPEQWEKLSSVQVTLVTFSYK